jgi:hypothetical protein
MCLWVVVEERGVMWSNCSRACMKLNLVRLPLTWVWLVSGQPGLYNRVSRGWVYLTRSSHIQAAR